MHVRSFSVVADAVPRSGSPSFLVVVPVSPVSAAPPLTSGTDAHSLMVWFSSLPDDQPGTRDAVQVMLGHSVLTENGSVAGDWYNFEIHVGQYTVNEDLEWVSGWWASYSPPVPVAPVTFSPRSAFASRTLHWQCDRGSCPTTMPSSIDVTVTAWALGAPHTTTDTGPGRPGPSTGISQEYDAVVAVDTGGALALPTLRYAWLSHNRSQTVAR